MQERKKITATIDVRVADMLDEYMKDNHFENKSKLIERLIKNELKKKNIITDEKNKI